MINCIAEGEAWKGVVVACFDCCKPRGQDWVTGRSMVEMDERADAGEVVCAGGLGDEVGGGKGCVECKGRRKWCVG